MSIQKISRNAIICRDNYAHLQEKRKVKIMSNNYINLLSQAEKLYRHNRQGSFKTKERYFEAYKRFLHFVGDVFHLQKLQSI